MRSPGVIGLVRLGAVLAVAGPMLLFGAGLAFSGRPLVGGGLVAIAASMLFLQWWLPDPLDPGDLVEAAADRVGRDREP